MWFIIRRAKPEILPDSDTCETKCYLCRENRRKPLYRINDSFASRFFSFQRWKRLGHMWEVEACEAISMLSYFEKRSGNHSGRWEQARVQFCFNCSISDCTILLTVLGYLEITLLQMDFEILFLMLQNNHFKDKY